MFYPGVLYFITINHLFRFNVWTWPPKAPMPVDGVCKYGLRVSILLPFIYTQAMSVPCTRSNLC